MKCKCVLPVGGSEMPSSFSSPSAASAGYKHKTQISLVVGSAFILLDTGTQLETPAYTVPFVFLSPFPSLGSDFRFSIII